MPTGCVLEMMIEEGGVKTRLLALPDLRFTFFNQLTQQMFDAKNMQSAEDPYTLLLLL